jgi:hypothetical protein
MRFLSVSRRIGMTIIGQGQVLVKQLCAVNRVKLFYQLLKILLFLSF